MKVLVSGDHNAPWLGLVKPDWGAVPIKYVATINPESLGESTDDNHELIYIDIGNVDSNGNIKEVQPMRFGNAPSRARRVVRKGDVIVSTVRTYLRAIATVDFDDPRLVVSTGFAVLRANPKQVYPGFLRHWVQSDLVVNEVCARSVGVSYPATNASEVGSIPIVLPPLPTQRAIADFLDRKTAAIDDLIAKKEQMLGLLAEKRAALIHRAVTKGLDPTVPMKDSGVPWIGEIPAHWSVKRLKFLAQVRGGVTKGRSLVGKSIVTLPYLRVANVQDGFVDLSHVAEIEVGVNEVPRYSLRPGDILMNEGGDSDKLGRGCVWEGQIDSCLHQNHVFAVRPLSGTNPHWISYCTSAAYLRFFFLSRANQSTNLASISSSNVKEAPIVSPPASEQGRIVAELDQRLASHDSLADRVARSRTRLVEYRQALITAAVTGQLDLSQADADLPAEPLLAAEAGVSL